MASSLKVNIHHRSWGRVALSMVLASLLGAMSSARCSVWCAGGEASQRETERNNLIKNAASLLQTRANRSPVGGGRQGRCQKLDFMINNHLHEDSLDFMITKKGRKSSQMYGCPSVTARYQENNAA